MNSRTAAKRKRVEHIVYSIDADACMAHRNVQTVGFWGIGLIQSQRILVQSENKATFVDEVAKAIVRDLENTHPSDLQQFRKDLDEFEARLADSIRRGLKRSHSIEVNWETCVRLLERSLPDMSMSLSRLLMSIRRFEDQLEQAGAGLAAGTSFPTRNWNIESMILVTLSRGRYEPGRIWRFAYDLMDFKFKVFCIASIDLPAYVTQVRALGASTPAGRIAALSFDSILGFKLRSVWETVMNMTYYLETGKDAEDWGKNKSSHWWKWIQHQRRWRGLAKFHRTVERYENLVRTPEAHKSSRMRATFAANRSARLHRRLGQDLANLSIAVWDHLIAVVGVDKGMTYHRRRQVLKTRQKGKRP